MAEWKRHYDQGATVAHAMSATINGHKVVVSTGGRFHGWIAFIDDAAPVDLVTHIASCALADAERIAMGTAARTEG